MALFQVGLQVQHLAQPGDLLVKLRVTVFFFVPPVGSHAVLSLLMHLLGADLNFHRLLVRPEDLRVQRPILIRFRICNMVRKLARHWHPQ